MAFRRDSDRSHHWRQWLLKHHDALVAMGLPDFVYSDERRWKCFLQEGGLDWESRWNVEMMSPSHAGLFRDFVLKEFGPEQHKCCLRALELVLHGKPRGSK